MPAQADSRNKLSTHVVKAVAEITQTDPLSVEPPLYEEIDPDALDNLFEANAAFRIRFSYAGHDVEIRSDAGGSVDVDVREASGE